MSRTADAISLPAAFISRNTLVLLLPFLLALVWLVFLMPYAAGYADFRFTIAQWLKIQWQQPTWQHGALAPLIAGFLVWRQRHALARIEKASHWTGMALAVFACFIFWAGYVSNAYFAGYASLQILAAAAVVWLWGWRCFKQVSFAWLVLLFAWPCLFLEDTLAFQLRYLMVSMTSRILNIIGIGTLQDGTSLISAASGARAQGEWFTLTVDGPCSGMRSLFALMMLSLLYGYFRQRSFWRRLVIFLLGVPLAVLANTIRILLLVFASIIFGQKFAVGHGEDYTSNFHLVAGVAVFLAAASGLRGAEALLNRFFGREAPLPVIPR